MSRNEYAQHVHKKRSFFSTLAWGGSVLLVTVIACGTCLALYGMNIIDRKTDTVTGFVREAVRSVPDIIDSLPPVVADVLEDQRMPAYAEALDVSARLVRFERPGRRGQWIRPIIEVQNNGDELVSLLSMRVVILDEDGDPVDEVNEWAATPIAAARDWRGPLMPGAKRHIVSHHLYLGESVAQGELRAEVEITDVRIWKPEARQTTAVTGAAEEVALAAE
ncbi:MAG TPA: hypothetical protein VM243_20130 [Phycisphaerae bacterium]|nr:hypothetical protein [Phycisphaerae bacterium]